MKKYFLLGAGQTHRPHYPFWKPWGCLGCLGRTLGFLFSLALFMLLLLLLTTLPRSCDDKQPGGNPEKPVLYNPGDDWIHDTVPDNTPPDRQPVKNPPKPFMPDPGDIIDDPGGIGQIDGRHLFVIIDQSKSQANPAMPRFVEEFSSLYPDCNVEIADEATQMVLLAVPEEKREQVRTQLPGQITDVAFYIDVVEIFGLVKEIPDPAMKEPAASWHLREVLAPEAWDVTTGDPGVKVAVIDSYFDLTHPDFWGMKIVNPVSVENGTTYVLPPTAQDAHGTHVLGLIGAQINGIGTAGVAPGCSFMPISLGRTPNSFTIVGCVLYALHNGANVINASLGFLAEEDIPIEEQVRRWKASQKRLQGCWDYVSDMLDRNYCTIVWASGNENLFELMDFAKRSESVIRVDAVDSNLNKASFSNFGNFDITVDGEQHEIRASQISAPGVDIISTVPGRQFGLMGGTSMAAPIVTGAVALMKSIDPTLTNAEIIKILNTTARPLANDSIGPLLQIRPALDAVKKNMSAWDDFKADPTGLWKKTDQSTYISIETSEFKYYAHDYLIFETRNNGIFEVHVVGEDRVYNARFNVRWGTDEAFLDIIPPIKSPDAPDGIVTQRIRVFKDSDGQVGYQVVAPDEGHASNIRLLRKDDRINKNKRPI